MVEEASVSLNIDKTMSTDLDGKYGFNNSILGGNYTVVPTKDGDVLNGVTILDVYLVLHLYGLL